MKRSTILTVLSLVSIVSLASAQLPTASIDSTLLAGFRWRSIGPANMSGRVTDVEGIPSPSRTFFVAAATGGIWKTTNAGTTFRPVFDNERVISMGDLAIAPSDTMIVWAGTGEEDSRNSISPGGGIYKSTDGGLTWELKGLEKTQSIGRIVVHPTNPEIVYVAALGHPWGANDERGLYRTQDGGDSWELVKFISNKAGFVDLVMHPTNPNVLFASSWERVRGPYFLKSGGSGSALWKTEDGGDTWTRVEGGGFPETTLGRIGIAIAPSNPNIMYTLVEADTGQGHTTRPSGLYRSEDGGATWEKRASNNSRPFYYSQVRVDPEDPDRVYWSSTPVNFSDDGGSTVRNATVGVHVDHHAMWIDPNDPNHLIVGNDGGIAQTWDRGGNYDVINIMPLGQVYAVSYNWDVPYRVCGGLQDNGTWCGPSRLARGAITNHHWYTVNGGDGFYAAQDPNDSDLMYAESQGGNMSRINLRTGERTGLQKPNWRQRWLQWEDSVMVDWPDTTMRLRGETRRRVEQFKRRQAADSAGMDLRWNWSTPFFISVHNPSVLYAGANRVLKSTERGDNLYFISPDLTTQDQERIKISTETTGGITPDVTGAETHSTITALAESPVRPGLLFSGTDDGNVWMTRNDGGEWQNLTGRFPGVPAKTWVSRIEPSHHDSARFYVTFDGHRDDDFTPYVFVTHDFGQTFQPIAHNLPTGGPDFVHVIREDHHNEHLLFVGTDVGVYFSTDRGTSWSRFMESLPTVPVHDLRIHPRDRELIAGTHGRSIWIVDIAPLEQLTQEVLAADAYFFEPKTAYQFGGSFVGGGSVGQKTFQARSPQYGAEIVYLATNGQDSVQIVIQDVKGDTVQTLNGSGRAGLHRVTWNFRGKAPPRPPLSPAAQRDSVIQARRVEFVFDSLVQAEVMPEPMANRMKERVLAGNTQQIFRALGFGGGGQGGDSDEWVERPGEQAPRGRGAGFGRGGPRPRPEADSAFAGRRQMAGADSTQAGPGRRGRPGAGGRNPFAALAGMDRSELFGIFRALRRPGQRRFGGRRGGGGPLVTTGDYLVSINLNGETLQRVLRVEKSNGVGPVTLTGTPD